MAEEFIYKTPLWRVRRLGDGWYQGETALWPAPTTRTSDFHEARQWIETQVERFLAENGYQRVGVELPRSFRVNRELAEHREYLALEPAERAAYDYHGQRGHDHAACMEAARGKLEGPYCERAECGNPLSFDDQQAGDGLCEYCAESEQEEADAEPTAEQLRADAELDDSLQGWSSLGR